MMAVSLEWWEKLLGLFNESSGLPNSPSLGFSPNKHQANPPPSLPRSHIPENTCKVLWPDLTISEHMWVHSETPLTPS